MHLTRQELEDIWENKPYGYFAKMVKDLKGKKKFRVVTEATCSTVIDKEEQIVWAKDANAAQYLAHYDSCGKIRRRLAADDYRKISYSTKAQEVQQ